MPYPGVYQDENEIIPYSPRRKFGFTGSRFTSSTDKIIKIESMKHMTIDQIVELYKNGYRIEDTSTIVTAQDGIYISTGALLLGIGLVALIYYMKIKGKI